MVWTFYFLSTTVGFKIEHRTSPKGSYANIIEPSLLWPRFEDFLLKITVYICTTKPNDASMFNEKKKLFPMLKSNLLFTLHTLIGLVYFVVSINVSFFLMSIEKGNDSFLFTISLALNQQIFSFTLCFTTL